MNLSRNNLGDKFVEVLCEALNTDTYIKSIALTHNCIGAKGFKKLSQIALTHPRLLSIELSGNSGELKSEHQLEVMKYAFLKNIKAAI